MWGHKGSFSIISCRPRDKGSKHEYTFLAFSLSQFGLCKNSGKFRNFANEVFKECGYKKLIKRINLGIKVNENLLFED